MPVTDDTEISIHHAAESLDLAIANVERSLEQAQAQLEKLTAARAALEDVAPPAPVRAITRKAAPSVTEPAPKPSRGPGRRASARTEAALAIINRSRGGITNAEIKVELGGGVSKGALRQLTRRLSEAGRIAEVEAGGPGKPVVYGPAKSEPTKPATRRQQRVAKAAFGAAGQPGFGVSPTRKVQEEIAVALREGRLYEGELAALIRRPAPDTIENLKVMISDGAVRKIGDRPAAYELVDG